MGLVQNPLAAANSVHKERKSEKDKTKDGFVKILLFFLFTFSSSRVFVVCTLLCSYKFFHFAYSLKRKSALEEIIQVSSSLS